MPLSRRVHGDVVILPVPLLVTRTVPVGVSAFGTSVSVTVMVQVVLEPIPTGAGAHMTLDAVDRGFMVQQGLSVKATLPL